MSRAAGSALAGALLVLSAFAWGTPELLVPGLALVVLAALIPPWVLAAARGASATRTIDGDRIVEDQPLEARIEVRRGPLGLPGAEVLDPLAGGSIRLSGPLLTLRPGRTTDIRVVARFARRGRQRLEPPAVRLRDPLGLVQVTRRRADAAQAVLVLPRTERVRWLRADTGRALGSRADATAVDGLAATEVDGLRPYRRGTPASRISWTALARGAGLLERRLVVERESGPLIVLDAACDELEHLDAAVRAAASLTVELARRGGCELLLPGDRRPQQVEPDLGAWSAAHARLALIEGGPEASAPAWRSRRSGAIFYVAARKEGLPGQIFSAGRGALVLVLPDALTLAGAHTPSFAVSGCRGYLLAPNRTAEPQARAA